MVNTKTKEKLIGKTCWRSWDGLLPAIFFELGEQKDLKTGEYSICFDTCPWQIFSKNIEIANSKNSKNIISEVLSKFVGKKLTDFEFNEENLTVVTTFDELKIVAYLNEKNDNFYVLGLD